MCRRRNTKSVSASDLHEDSDCEDTPYILQQERDAHKSGISMDDLINLRKRADTASPQIEEAKEAIKQLNRTKAEILRRGIEGQ